MSEEITLRNKPIFKIIINENNMVIENDSDKNDNNTYKFEDLDSLEIQVQSVNWFITILSYIVSFIGGPAGGLFKERDLLIFDYKKDTKKILLTECDMTKARQIVKKINTYHLKTTHNNI